MKSFTVTLPFPRVRLRLASSRRHLTSWLSYWDHGFDRILEGKPTVIVEDGKLDVKGMRKERMSELDVMSELRLNGIDDIEEVKRQRLKPMVK